MRFWNIPLRVAGVRGVEVFPMRIFITPSDRDDLSSLTNMESPLVLGLSH